jgi:hypothetical protein
VPAAEFGRPVLGVGLGVELFAGPDLGERAAGPFK